MPEDQPNTEQELLARVAQGDEKAFHELVNSYAHLLYTFIFRIIGDRPITEDLVQDVFVKIWLTRETLAEVRNFKAYLFIVSRNFAIKAAQKALREQKKLNEFKLLDAGDASPQDREWKFLLIEEAIASLPPQQLKVWTMSRKQGMKYTEIAEELGLSRESVKKYLQHANASIMKYVKNRLDVLAAIAIYLHG